MRIVLAGLFVFFGTAAAVATVAEVPAGEPPVWVLSSVGVVSFLVLLVLAFVLFNRTGAVVKRGDPEDFIRKLEDGDLLTSEDFEARRAFEIREFEDEGSHFMLELRDGTVLYLNGQYLYDYEPIDDDPELNQPRLFPCTSFTVRRHRTEGYVVDMDCRGDVLEPECVAPYFDGRDAREGWIPEDGQIFTDRSYEELKAERTRA